MLSLNYRIYFISSIGKSKQINPYCLFNHRILHNMAIELNLYWQISGKVTILSYATHHVNLLKQPLGLRFGSQQLHERSMDGTVFPTFKHPFRSCVEIKLLVMAHHMQFGVMNHYMLKHSHTLWAMVTRIKGAYGAHRMSLNMSTCYSVLLTQWHGTISCDMHFFHCKMYTWRLQFSYLLAHQVSFVYYDL